MFYDYERIYTGKTKSSVEKCDKKVLKPFKPLVFSLKTLITKKTWEKPI